MYKFVYIHEQKWIGSGGVELKNLIQNALLFFLCAEFHALEFPIYGIKKNSFEPIGSIAVNDCLTEVFCSNGLDGCWKNI